jgi:hypothetical protein
MREWSWDDGALGARIDLCEDCEHAGKYICRYCMGIHDDNDPCEMVRVINEQDKRAQFADYPESTLEL